MAPSPARRCYVAVSARSQKTMLSRSAPQLQYLVEKAKTGAEQARELQQTRKELSKNARTLAAIQSERRGYKFGRCGAGQLAITIDPHIFFGKTEPCLHRPTRVNWTKPMKVLRTAPVDGGSPLNGITSPVMVEVMKQEVAAASMPQQPAGNEKMEKELGMMQIRYETLRAEFKAAIHKLKSTHDKEVEEFDRQHQREIMLLEEAHKQVLERLTEEHSAELYALESQHTSEMAEVDSLNGMLKTRIQKMISEHKQQLETQHRELEEAHAQKMQDLEQRLTEQYEREFEERLALHINALVVQQKQELLEAKRVHEEQISILRKRFTKPALLMQELEHSHKTIATQKQELDECGHKLTQTAAELRQTQAELSVVSDNLKFYVSCSAEKTRETEEKYRSSMNELLQQNTRIRQTMLVQREELGRTRLQGELEQKEIRMKLYERMNILVRAKRAAGLLPEPKKATRSQSTPKELP